MKRILFVALCLFGASAHAQTAADPQVWSCLTNCSATSNTYSDGQWRSSSSRPAYVAATTGTNTNCSTRWWNTSGAIRWRRIQDVLPVHCVAARRSTTEDVFLSASVLWPVASSVDCQVSDWSAWSEGPWSACIDGTRSRTDQRTRTVVTPASNGGQACPALTESRTVSEACSLPPPPPVSVVISITSQRVYTNEPVTVSWTSQNAISCSASWTQDPVPFSGSQTITMTVPMAFARVYVRCIGTASEYEAGTGWVVLSRAPDCYAKTPDDRDKVNVKALSAANISLRYQIAAVWWCASPNGPVQQRFVLGVQDQETIAAFRKWLDRQFDEAGVRARCERDCQVLPEGALKQELDSWAQLPENSAAVLGVIQP